MKYKIGDTLIYQANGKTYKGRVVYIDPATKEYKIKRIADITGTVPNNMN